MFSIRIVQCFKSKFSNVFDYNSTIFFITIVWCFRKITFVLNPCFFLQLMIFIFLPESCASEDQKHKGWRLWSLRCLDVHRTPEFHKSWGQFWSKLRKNITKITTIICIERSIAWWSSEDNGDYTKKSGIAR